MAKIDVKLSLPAGLGGKLFGEKDLTPEERQLYHEVQDEGYETTPSRVRKFFPDKEKIKMNFGPHLRKKKSTKSKSKRKVKKGCGCK